MLRDDHATASVLRRARRRRSAGYTMAELAIAAALTGMLLTATVVWVTSLLGITTTQAAVSVPRTSVQFVTDQLRSDLANATSCSPQGLAPPLLRVTDTELHLYIDDHGRTARVSWLYDPSVGQLSRSETPDPFAVGYDPDAHTVTCDTSELPSVDDLAGDRWVPVASFVTPADQVDGSTGPVFTGVGGPDPGFVGDCADSSDDACLFTHVRTHLRVSSPTGTASTLDRAFEINPTASRL